MFEEAVEHEAQEKPFKDQRHGTTSGKSSTCSREDLDAIEQQETNGAGKEEYEAPSQSSDLKRTASNVLTKVASRLTARSIVDPPPPPDGGLKAWTQVAMTWLVVCTTWGWINSFGAFQNIYRTSLDESASTISWIGSVQNFLTFFVAAFSGRLLDAGLFIPAFLVGATLQVLGIFMMSLSTKYWQLLLTQGIMTGLGGGLFFCPAMGIVGTYFSSHRALALGIATSGNSIGGIIYPVLVQQLLPKIGFAWTTRVLGFFNLACLCLVFVFLRPRLPPRKSGPLIDLSAFKERTYVLLVAGYFFAMWAIYYTFYYLSSYGSEVIGLPFSASITITIVLNGAGCPARIIPPFFADRFGQLNVMTPILFVLAIVAFCWLAVDSAAGVYVYTVFYGITSAAFQCLLPSTVASITTNMNHFGTRLGMAFGTLSFAALTGPSIGGAIQAAMAGKFLGAQIFAGISTAVCALLIFGARTSKAGLRLDVKC